MQFGIYWDFTWHYKRINDKLYIIIYAQSDQEAPYLCAMFVLKSGWLFSLLLHYSDCQYSHSYQTLQNTFYCLGFTHNRPPLPPFQLEAPRWAARRSGPAPWSHPPWSFCCRWPRRHPPEPGNNTWKSVSVVDTWRCVGFKMESHQSWSFIFVLVKCLYYGNGDHINTNIN